jgi:predicted ATPase/transcriptional regulator with XRE-family HTH domain
MEAASRLHFGELLRQFRLDARLTQQQLAERAKLSVEAIGALERGARTRPYRETVVLLARALELSPERGALLESSIDVAHSPRRRERVDALKPSLLRIVRPETQTTSRHNLPHLVTSFVGRENEVREVTALLREHRLVTVVGAGGVGKTRIAVQLGSELLDSSPDGVWLVDLAPLADQTLVASTILSTLQLPSTTGSPSDIVVAYLKTRSLLLILDNCEHVIAAVREVAATIVQSCSYVRILATSREALDAPGERVYRLPSMAVPPDSRGRAQEALHYGAVTLFVDRAHAVNSSFALVDENAPDVSEICRRLDGIPLAIELAAARVSVLAPRQIAERLDQRFRLLTGGNTQALPRHQTMTALIDWSYDFLTAREQRFFESLSVFAGGCTLEAATTVCASDGEDDLDVLDLVASLASKSLLLAESVGNEQRYRLLESSRQYANAKLIARGEQAKLARRHALFYVELAEQWQREWDTMPDHAWLPQATLELENWRVALEWSLVKRGDVIFGQRLAAVRAVMWRGFTLVEGRRWVRQAMAFVDEGTPLRIIAELEHSEAEGARRLGDFKMAFTMAERALSRYRELADVAEIAATQSLAGAMLTVLGRPAESEPLLREALELADTLGDIRLRAVCLQRLGLAGTWLGDLTGSRVYLTEALGLAKILGATILGGSVSTALAQNAYLAGDPETAVRLIGDVITDYRSLNSPGTAPNIVNYLTDSATYLIALRRYDDARAQASEALVVARSFRLVYMLCRSLHHLAVLALLRQGEGEVTAVDLAGAARIFGFVEARLTALAGNSEEELDRKNYQSALAVVRNAISSDELTRLMATGAAMTEDEAIAQAEALGSLA